MLIAVRLKPLLFKNRPLSHFERGYFPMAKKETASPAIPVFPMLKTVEQMSKISGIGENKLRELMDSGELEYIQNGNRRLIADAAIWDWYHRAKTTAKPPARQGG
jgi:hypothetical protein